MSDLYIKIDELARLSKGRISSAKGLLKAAVKRSSVLHCTRDHRHNGWTNYETWATALWMDNEEGTQTYWREVADDVYARRAEADKHFTKAERAALLLAEAMKDEHEERAEQLLEETSTGASVFADLLNGALSEVNWHEIAQHYIDAITAEEPKDENDPDNGNHACDDSCRSHGCRQAMHRREQDR